MFKNKIKNNFKSFSKIGIVLIGVSFLKYKYDDLYAFQNQIVKKNNFPFFIPKKKLIPNIKQKKKWKSDNSTKCDTITSNKSCNLFNM